MTRFVSDHLDLSRFPAPLAIRGIDFAAILAERKVQLVRLFNAFGVPYDVETLETDSAIVLQEADAYREMLKLAAINDAVRAVMVAFAVGADLQHLAAFYGIGRRIVRPASDGVPAELESDAELRRRTLLAPEAFAAAGPAGAYVFHALQADPRVLAVDVWTPGPGRVCVALQARDGDGTAPSDLVSHVRAHLTRDDIKPLTDVVDVFSVRLVPYYIDGAAFVLPGPDVGTVREAVLAGVAAMTADRRTPGRDVPLSAIVDAASVPAVDEVRILSPPGSVAVGRGELATCRAIAFSVATRDD